MAQLTVLNPDGFIVDVILISDSLASKLTEILQSFNRDSLDLAWLREIKLGTLSSIFESLKEEDIKMNNNQEIQNFAISTIDWFDELLDVIVRIEQLPNPDSLTICLSE